MGTWGLQYACKEYLAHMVVDRMLVHSAHERNTPGVACAEVGEPQRLWQVSSPCLGATLRAGRTSPAAPNRHSQPPARLHEQGQEQGSSQGRSLGSTCRSLNQQQVCG